MQVDVCNQKGAWSIKMTSIIYNWKYDWPETNHLLIKYRETLAFMATLIKQHLLWANHNIIINNDSLTAILLVNKDTSKHNYIVRAFQRMFQLFVSHHFQLKAVHLAGRLNARDDTIQRLEANGRTALKRYPVDQILSTVYNHI